MRLTDRVSELERRSAESAAIQDAERKAHLAEVSARLAEGESKLVARASDEADKKLALRVSEAEKRASEKVAELTREQRVVAFAVVVILATLGFFNQSKLTGLETEVANQEQRQVVLDGRVAGMLQKLGEIPGMQSELARVRDEVDGLGTMTAPTPAVQASDSVTVVPVKNGP